ncbi:DUF2897 family protein [Thaumasiovibrio sp. DFM-14]|uniref:DUF2897 family protein n=1 Tax=Thaumasiovibrio sp. DFM-14 TaxID=3384792 RepID=UPI0039A20FEA
MALLLNPWVISIVIISIVIGNIMALKYTANMTLLPKNKPLDQLLSADKQRQDHQTKH